MKQFFKFMFASMLGFFLSFIIIFFILVIIVSSIASLSKTDVVLVPKNSVLKITLTEPMNDRSSDNPFANFDIAALKSHNSPGLNDVLATIKKAKDDENIKGIYIELSNLPVGISKVEEIRNALIEFKKSGKFIISYSDVFTQKSYYLASISDKIYLNPQGDVDFKGLNADIMFFKGLLQKLDVEAQVIRHGKFKSAVEPFILDKLSKENKEQMLTYIGGLWNHMIKGISEQRKISIEELNKIANELLVRNANDAVKYKFIDKILFYDEVLAELRAKLSLKENDKVNFIALNKYVKAPNKEEKARTFKKKIAVVYAEGNIVDGEGEDNSIGSEKYAEVLRKLRIDSSVKAVVLRVNSPGGSGLASDIILREVKLIKKVKPIVVSMGDYAASGGYYISCAANKIICNPNTLTGSIGVFGIIPNIKGLLNNKLGVTVDNVKTNDNADYMTINRPLTDYQKLVLQKQVDDFYNTFITHVSEGRNIPVAKVDSMGQGRVWIGLDAKKLGLIDEFGGLDLAVKTAADLAKLKDYRVVDYPQQKDAFTKIIDELSGNTEETFIKEKLGDYYELYDYLESISQMKGVQARLPYQIILN